MPVDVLGGRRMRRLLPIGLALAALMAVLPPSALGAGRTVRLGSLPRFPAGTRVVGAVNAAQTLHLTVALKPRAPGILAEAAEAVSDPSSSRFHRYLTPAGFAARFAPTRSELDAVLAALRSQGLTPGPVSRDRLAIPVVAPAAAIERAFAVSLAQVRLPDGRLATMNSSRPAIDASVAGTVQSVLGLSSLSAPRPASSPVSAWRAGRPSAASAAVQRPQVATGGPQACVSARSTASSQGVYTSDQIASAYQFSSLFQGGDKGQRVTVAVYELEPDASSDIATYQRCYGTHTSIKYVTVDGGAGSGAGSGEAALDIEQLIGLAPRARLLVYQGPNSNSGAPGSGPYDVYNAIVSQDRASVVSTSWGACEPLEGQSDAVAENTLFQEAALQGQTIVAASGDSGSEGCYGSVGVANPIGLAVQDPSSQPFTTGVGGTTMSATGPPPTQSTWNNGLGLFGGGAGGGGVSTFWAMPPYQRSAPGSLGVIGSDSSGSPCSASAGDCREVPDVSADADPNTGYLIYYSGSTGGQMGWQGIGGTSAGAPLWAALIALADANRACASQRLGFVNPTLYRLAGSDQAGYFTDVTKGNNDYTGTGGGRYPAGSGYDMATGLGTPKAGVLARALCKQGLRMATPRTQHSRLRRRVKLRLRVSDARHAGLRLSATGLPPGLRLRAARRRVTGRPRHTGTFNVTLRASDSGGAVRAVHFVWKVRRR